MEKILEWLNSNIPVVTGAVFAFCISLMTIREGSFRERLTKATLCSIFSTGIFYGMVSIFPTCPPEAAVAKRHSRRTTRMMTLSEAGRDAIIRREGLRLTAYTCEAGKLTIGIGHTGRDVYKGQHITEEKAAELFAKDTAPVEAYLNTLAYPFTQGQFDALVSFIHNIGLPRFKQSTMLIYIKGLSQPERIAGEFARWVWVSKIKREKLKNGIVQETTVKVQSKGLLARRESERRQFLTGIAS